MKIEVCNVCKQIKKVEVLKNINMVFEDGKIYGFSGRNGSGKSVLLKIICGIYSPTNGEVLIDGKNYNRSNMFVPNLRALIEKPSFFPDLIHSISTIIFLKILYNPWRAKLNRVKLKFGLVD